MAYKIEFILYGYTSSGLNDYTVEHTLYEKDIKKLKIGPQKVTSRYYFKIEPQTINFTCKLDSWINTNIFNSANISSKNISKYEIRLYWDDTKLFAGIIDMSTVDRGLIKNQINFNIYDRIRILNIYAQSKAIYSATSGYNLHNYIQGLLSEFSQEQQDELGTWSYQYVNPTYTLPTINKTNLVLDEIDTHLLHIKPNDGGGVTYTWDATGAGGSDSGNITAYASEIVGEVRITSNNHGLSAGNTIRITDSTNYNGVYPIYSVPNANQYIIPHSFVGDDGCGTWFKQNHNLYDYSSYNAVVYALKNKVVIKAVSAGGTYYKGIFQIAVFYFYNRVFFYRKDYFHRTEWETDKNFESEVDNFNVWLEDEAEIPSGFTWVSSESPSITIDISHDYDIVLTHTAGSQKTEIKYTGNILTDSTNEIHVGEEIIGNNGDLGDNTLEQLKVIKGTLLLYNMMIYSTPEGEIKISQKIIGSGTGTTIYDSNISRKKEPKIKMKRIQKNDFKNLDILSGKNKDVIIPILQEEYQTDEQIFDIFIARLKNFDSFGLNLFSRITYNSITYQISNILKDRQKNIYEIEAWSV